MRLHDVGCHFKIFLSSLEGAAEAKYSMAEKRFCITNFCFESRALRRVKKNILQIF
jgi:hypothetical protein